MEGNNDNLSTFVDLLGAIHDNELSDPVYFQECIMRLVNDIVVESGCISHRSAYYHIKHVLTWWASHKRGVTIDPDYISDTRKKHFVIKQLKEDNNEICTIEFPGIIWSGRISSLEINHANFDVKRSVLMRAVQMMEHHLFTVLFDLLISNRIDAGKVSEIKNNKITVVYCREAPEGFIFAHPATLSQFIRAIDATGRFRWDIFDM